MKINVVMIAKDEERCIKKCLQAAAPLADRMIVADTGSRDDTPRIAEKMGAEVWTIPWDGDFSKARNQALEKSDGDWNLVLDADEYLITGDRKTLEQAIAARNGQWMGVISRIDLFRDQEGIQKSCSLIPRLLPAGVRYQGMIHEQPDGPYPLFPVPLEAEHDGYLQPGKGERNLKLLQEAVNQNPEDGYLQFQMASTLYNLGREDASLKYFQGFCRFTSPKEHFWPQGIILYLYALMRGNKSQSLEEGSRIAEREDSRLGGRSDFCFACGLLYMKLVLSDTRRYIRYFPRIESSWLKCLALGEQKLDGAVLGCGSFKAAYNLGLFYELSGKREQAARFYYDASEAGYSPAKQRLESLLGINKRDSLMDP